MKRKHMLGRILSIMTATIMAVTSFGFVPESVMKAFAAPSSGKMFAGPEGLKEGMNTENAKLVHFGDRNWCAIGYDGEGVAAESGEVSFLSEDGIKSINFGNASDESYVNSTLKTEIEKYANDSFSDKEKAVIAPRDLAAVTEDDTGDVTWWVNNYQSVDAVYGENTISGAKLWPLSAKEACALNATLRKTGTDYWLGTPGRVGYWDYYYYGMMNKEYYYVNPAMAIVNADGNVAIQKDNLTYWKGMRPAFKMKTDDIVLVSPATGGKYSAEDGTLSAPEPITGKKVKLTVKDESYGDDLRINPCDVRYGESGSITIEYSTYAESVFGDNEYISAIIKGTDGSVKQYGRLGKVQARHGTVTIKGLPTDATGKACLADGDKLYIFKEKCNGDNQTDYASNPVEIRFGGHDWVFSEISNTMYNPVYYARYWCRTDYTHHTSVATTKTEAHIPATCESYGSNTQTYSVTAEQSPDGVAHSRSFGDVDWNNPPLHHDYSIFADVKWTGSVAAYTKAEFIFSCSHDRSHRTSVEGDITTRVEEPTCTGIGRTVYQANLPADRSPDGERHGSAKYGNAKPALGHDWNEPTYTWSADNSSVTATRVCKRDSSHVETETVETTMNITTSPTCKATGVADFTTKPYRNSAFTEQTKTNQEIPIDPDAHEWEMEGEAIGHNECGASIVREKCTLCGKTEETAYGGDNHDFEEAWTYYPEPTCTEGGQRFHKCTKCGVFDFDNFEVLNAKGHQWKFVDFTWTGNETDGYEKAVANYVCENDSSHTMSLDAAISEEVIDPTCQEGGKTVYTATISAADSPDEVKHSESKDANATATDKASHEWEYSGMEWSGNETDGYTGAKAKYTCKHNCGQEELVNATITEDETKPTCEDGGKTTYTAKVTSEESFTGEENTDTKDAKFTEALGHEWDLNDVIWTGDEENGFTKAVMKFVCENDKSHEELVEAKITKEVIEPTCIEQGYTMYKALLGAKDSPTGYEITDYNFAKRKAATGHDWEFKNFTWTPDDKYGYLAQANYVCKHDKSHDGVMGASIRATEITATCEEPGGTLYTAIVSKENSLTDAEVTEEKLVKTADPIGHKWDAGKVTKEPTESTEGVKTYTCTACKAIRTESIPKLDPSEVDYRNTEGEGQTWYRGSNKAAEFIFKRSKDDSDTYSHFTGIKVDGSDVSTSDYTAESGSVVIKLKPEYLETLKTGDHKLTAVFDDGSATVTFRIADSGNGSSGSDSSGRGGSSDSKGAKTGDSTDIFMWFAMILSATLALTGTAAVRRKRRNQ